MIKTYKKIILSSLVFNILLSCSPELESMGKVIRREARVECTSNRMLRTGQYLSIEVCYDGVELAINSIRGNIFDEQEINRLCEEEYQQNDIASCKRGVEFVKRIINEKQKRMLSSIDEGPNEINNDQSEYAKNIHNGPRGQEINIQAPSSPARENNGAGVDSV